MKKEILTKKKHPAQVTHSFIFLLFLTLSIFIFPSDPITQGGNPQWIIWNVGQGQWTTYSSGSLCLHFDMGGEFMSWKKILEECRKKKNYLFLSHGDWDHIRWIQKAKKKLRHFCLQSFPRESLSPSKKKYLSSFRPCSKKESSSIRGLIHEVQWFKFQSRKVPVPTQKKLKKNDQRQKSTKWQQKKDNIKFKANDLSRIYILKQQVLLPGDSTRKAEKIWSKKLRPFSKSLKWLLAPHHGSHTSTSKELLSVLKNLKTVIISARKKRYGHPHSIVILRLKEKKVSILRTEIWGNIRIEI